DKMTPDAIARLMRALVPVSLAIESVEGTWKLNQNKPDAGRRGAADALAALDRDAPGSEAARLAALMRAVEAGEG
ncbi:MAG: FMN-binding negative transcriptional regulator, partial [Pseudomonadota bacterium]